MICLICFFNKTCVHIFLIVHFKDKFSFALYDHNIVENNLIQSIDVCNILSVKVYFNSTDEFGKSNVSQIMKHTRHSVFIYSSYKLLITKTFENKIKNRGFLYIYQFVKCALIKVSMCFIYLI